MCSVLKRSLPFSHKRKLQLLLIVWCVCSATNWNLFCFFPLWYGISCGPSSLMNSPQLSCFTPLTIYMRCGLQCAHMRPDTLVWVTHTHAHTRKLQQHLTPHLQSDRCPLHLGTAPRWWSPAPPRCAQVTPEGVQQEVSSSRSIPPLQSPQRGFWPPGRSLDGGESQNL